MSILSVGDKVNTIQQMIFQQWYQQRMWLYCVLISKGQVQGQISQCKWESANHGVWHHENLGACYFDKGQWNPTLNKFKFDLFSFFGKP